MKEQKTSNSNGIRNRVVAICLMCLIIVLLFSTAAAASREKAARIVLKVDAFSMIQEQALPALAAKASTESDGKAIIDQSTEYTVENLMDDLNSGKGYTLQCDADGMTEGSFLVKIVLDENIENSLTEEWLGKVEINLEDGKLEVQNKYGAWDKKDNNKFVKTDGSYVMNDFIVSKGVTYFFDNDGNKATGWQEINGSKYFFDKDGAMQTGWHEEDGSKYYLDADGRMHISWLELDGVKYCFGDDGKMLTGEQQVGSKKCVFASDGKLESEESNIDPTKPMIALTFDDGPGERTMELLDVVEQYGAHVTFFMQGVNIQNTPNSSEIIQRMQALGCELGNHTMTHPQLSKLDANGVREQVEGVNDLIRNAVGVGASVLRNPYGDGTKSDTVKANVGLPMVLWSVDTLDWKTKSKDATVDSVLNTAGDGDIVLMHDIHSWSVDAAIEAIPQLIAKGYQLVTVSEMAEARGIAMEPGGRYSEFWKSNQ